MFLQYLKRHFEDVFLFVKTIKDVLLRLIISLFALSQSKTFRNSFSIIDNAFFRFGPLYVAVESSAN